MKSAIKEEPDLYYSIAEKNALQVWPTRYSFKQGTYAAALLPNFKSHLENCGCYRDSDRQYLPSDLVSSPSPGLSRSAIVFPVANLALLYYILFPLDTNDINNSFLDFHQSQLFNPEDLDLSRDGELVLSRNTSYSGLKQSCMGTLNYALSSNITVPYADIKASMNVDNTKNVKISLIQGNFCSPLDEIFSLNTTKSIMYKLSLWKKYTSEDSLSYLQAIYLRDFEGAFVSNEVSAKGDAETAIESNLGVQFGPANFSASGKFRFKASEFSHSGTLKTIIFTNRESSSSPSSFSKVKMHYGKLPSPSELSSLFSALSYTKDQEPYVTNNSVVQLSFTLFGIPPSMNNANEWKIQETSKYFDESSLRLSIKKISAEDTTFSQGCQFVIEGRLKDVFTDEMIKNNSLIKPSFLIKNINEVRDNHLERKVDAILHPINTPRIDGIKNDYFPPQVAPLSTDIEKFSLKWEIPFNLVEGGNPTTGIEYFTTDTIYIDTFGVKYPIIADYQFVSNDQKGASATKKLIITNLGQANNKYSDYEQNKYIQATITTKISMLLKNSGTKVVPFYAKILLPQKKGVSK